MSSKVADKRLTTNFSWRFAERILAQLVSFIISTIIARKLLPADYGIIEIVNIFITFANVFVSEGWGTALIQKKNADETDFSSVFYSGFMMSIALYVVIFILAPQISVWYKIPSITIIIRVMGLRLIVASINTVQHAYVAKHMIFKKFFWSTLIGTIVSGILGVCFVYAGYGVWALVIQYMSNTVIDTIVLFITTGWHPRLLFSFIRLKSLLPYGGKILASSLVNVTYMEARSLVIGGRYDSADLANYNKGRSFPKLLVHNVDYSLSGVLFASLSSYQDQPDKVKETAKKSIKMLMYIITPLTIGLLLVARPFISVLLTDNWLSCVPYLQVYCVFYATIPLQTVNLQIIKALGRSDIYLRQEIIKKVVGITILIVSIPFGPLFIAITACLSNIFAVVLSMTAGKKLINYSFFEQIKDVAKSSFPVIVMSIVVIAIGFISLDNLLMLTCQVLGGIITYIGTSKITKNEMFIYITERLKNKIKKKTRGKDA